VLIGRAGVAWYIALAAAWLSLASAVVLHGHVIGVGSISYAFGGWAPPWGIEYRVDLLTSYVLLIVTAIGALVISFARLSVEHEIPSERIAQFYAVLLLALAGLAGIISTGDAFNLFVFLEISALS